MQKLLFSTIRDVKMKPFKIHGICGLIILFLIIPIINAAALSSWPVQKDDQLNFSFSYQYYDENNTLTEDTSAIFSILITNVDENLTYDISCDVNVKVGNWGSSLKNYAEGSNLTSTDEYLSVMALWTVIIYEASAFTDKENDWVTLINSTKEYFWIDVLTFSTYSADEITNMEFSSSSNAYGYKITAAWDDYKNLAAGSRSTEIKYSEDGVLLVYKDARHWVEKSGGYDLEVEKTDQQMIPGFSFGIFGLCSILGVVIIFLKNRRLKEKGKKFTIR